jgi:antitoxin component of RelBE/YafQ-DinJ toxin-antitoxin module
MKKIKIDVKVSPCVKKELKNIADGHGITLSKLLQNMFDHFIKHKDKKMDMFD